MYDKLFRNAHWFMFMKTNEDEGKLINARKGFMKKNGPKRHPSEW